MTRLTPTRSALALALGVAAASSAAKAQSDSASQRREPPRQVLSIQPLQAIAGVVAADYEHVVGRGFTLGVGASYWDAGWINVFDYNAIDASYSSAELKLRYYPSELPFRGVSVGFTAGGSYASFRLLDERFHASGVKIGSEADYNWLLGPKQRLALALGVGAKRIFYTAHGDRLVGIYPTSRIAIGWAF